MSKYIYLHIYTLSNFILLSHVTPILDLRKVHKQHSCPPLLIRKQEDHIIP